MQKPAVRLGFSILLLGLAACGGGSGAATVPSTASLSQSSGASGVISTVISGETPTSVSSFLNSIGVNVHLGETASYYGENPTEVEQRLILGGFRHYRDGGSYGYPNILTEYQTLGAAGVKVDVLSTYGVAVSQMQSWGAAIGPSALDSLEGPNEYNNSGDPNWAADDIAYQALLSPVASSLGVAMIAPSVTAESADEALGNLSADTLVANMHDYFAGNNPETSGSGASDQNGTYGSLTYNINLARLVVPNKFIWSTETGYSDNAADPNSLPDAVMEHYTLRTLFAQWNAGVTRTYLYELYDEGSVPYSHYGLISSSDNPKPAYVAIKRLITHLNDWVAPGTLTPLSYSITGNVDHTLLEHSNGTYALMLWVAAAEWNVNTAQPIAIVPVAVTLTFVKAPSAMAATTFDASGDATTTTLAASTSVHVQTTGMPTIIDIAQ